MSQTMCHPGLRKTDFYNAIVKLIRFDYISS